MKASVKQQLILEKRIADLSSEIANQKFYPTLCADPSMYDIKINDPQNKDLDHYIYNDKTRKSCMVHELMNPISYINNQKPSVFGLRLAFYDGEKIHTGNFMSNNPLTQAYLLMMPILGSKITDLSQVTKATQITAQFQLISKAKLNIFLNNLGLNHQRLVKATQVLLKNGSVGIKTLRDKQKNQLQDIYMNVISEIPGTLSVDLCINHKLLSSIK